MGGSGCPVPRTAPAPPRTKVTSAPGLSRCPGGPCPRAGTRTAGAGSGLGQWPAAGPLPVRRGADLSPPVLPRVTWKAPGGPSGRLPEVPMGCRYCLWGPGQPWGRGCLGRGVPAGPPGRERGRASPGRRVSAEPVAEPRDSDLGESQFRSEWNFNQVGAALRSPRLPCAGCVPWRGSRQPALGGEDRPPLVGSQGGVLLLAPPCWEGAALRGGGQQRRLTEASLPAGTARPARSQGACRLRSQHLPPPPPWQESRGAAEHTRAAAPAPRPVPDLARRGVRPSSRNRVPWRP